MQMLAVVYWGSGSAALGVLVPPDFRQTCTGEHQITCLRYEIACALVLLVGALTTSNAVMMHRARNRSNDPRLLVLLFGH
jgi:hypothetical protein